MRLPWQTSYHVFNEKIVDALTPGVIIDCDLHEAFSAGAFREEALTQRDAYASYLDLLPALEQWHEHADTGGTAHD